MQYHKKSAAKRRYRGVAISFLLAAALVVSLPSPAQALPPGFGVETVANGLQRPTDMAFASNGTIYVAEMAGRIRTITNGNVAAQPFIDMTPQVNLSSNRGLLGMALHPDFPNTPYIYVSYAYDPPETANFGGASGRDGSGQRVARLSRITADSGTNYVTAVQNSEVVLVGNASTWDNIADPSAGQDNFDQGWTCYEDFTANGIATQDCMPADGQSHSTGAVAFGPDGSLYFSNGDAASYNAVDPRAARAADLDSLAGKIMRIDPVSGQGLADNPFYDGNPSSNRSKVVNLGLRNPFRFTIDPNSGELWIGDVGWTAWEEMNTGTGQDFGWPCFEGGFNVSLQTGGYRDLPSCVTYYPTANATPPTVSWNREGTTGAAIAGPTYVGGSYPPEFDGARFYGDYTKGWIRYQLADGSTADFATGVPTMVDLELGPAGNLHVVDFLGGAIRRYVYDDPGGGFVCQVTNNPNGSVTVSWNNQNALGYDVIEDAAPAYWVTATSITDTSPAETYTIAAWGVPDNGKTTTCDRPGQGNNRPPVISNIADRVGNVDSTVTFFVGATDPDGDDLTFSATGLPANIQLRPRVGEFAGTLTQPGTFDVTVTVSDGRGGSDTTSFTWIVINPDFVCTATANADGSVSVQWDDLGANGYDVREDGANPFWTTSTSITDTSPGSVYQIQAWGLLIDNGRTTSCQVDGNSPPTISPIGNQTATVGSSVNVLVNATDPDGNALSFSATGLPPGPQIGLTTGRITGAPTQAGTYNVTVTANDGNGGTDTVSFTWTVNPAGGGFTCSVAINANGSATVTWNDQSGSGYDVTENGGFTFWVTGTSFVDLSPGTGYTVRAWGLGNANNGQATSCETPDNPGGFSCDLIANGDGSVTLTWNDQGGSGYEVSEDGGPPVWVTSLSFVDTSPGNQYEVQVWGLPPLINGATTSCT